MTITEIFNYFSMLSIFLSMANDGHAKIDQWWLLLGFKHDEGIKLRKF